MILYKKLKKAIHRVIRIVLCKKGIYGTIQGKGNTFSKGVFIEEGACIGKNNYFGPYTMINHALIKNYCSIGPGVKIGQGMHSIDYITTYQKISGNLINHSLDKKPTIIGNDVWCGANVVILQGVEIGDGAVIGANAVVTKDIPPYAIAVGIPAKVIKFRFKEEQIKEIRNSKWYECDIEESKELIKNLEKKILDKSMGVKYK